MGDVAAAMGEDFGCFDDIDDLTPAPAKKEEPKAVVAVAAAAVVEESKKEEIPIGEPVIEAVAETAETNEGE